MSKLKNNEREIINPSDKAYVDFTDKEAACLAVLFVGGGKYGIDGEDGMPVFIFGGSEEWVKNTFGKTIKELADSVSTERIKKALLSFRLSGLRSSLNDFVGHAHYLAGTLKKSTNDN